jgi:mono/diheme cytochrome c family protein
MEKCTIIAPRSTQAIARNPVLESGAVMKNAGFAILLSVFLAGALQAQQPNSPNALNETQKQGRLLFQQRCPICHSSVMITHRPYAPVLVRTLVVGNEGRIREAIANGRPGKMPGFKYGMSAAEIDSIIEYLKTVTAPFEMRPRGQADSGSQSTPSNAVE